MSTETKPRVAFVSGSVYTSNPMAAAAARFAFFDWLRRQHYTLDAYLDGHMWSDDDEEPEDEWELSFDDVPVAVWDRFHKVWVGSDAIYPYAAGCQVVTRSIQLLPKKVLTIPPRYNLLTKD